MKKYVKSDITLSDKDAKEWAKSVIVVGFQYVLEDYPNILHDFLWS